jgi:hypothetical protein
MNFLLDENISYRVCAIFKAAEHDAVHVRDMVHRQSGPAAVPPVITRVPSDYLSPPPTANPNPSDGWFRYSTPPPNEARPS